MKTGGACAALFFALHLACTVSQEVAYVNSSETLLEALSDEGYSQIVLTGDIVLQKETWSTVVITNRTIAMNGTDDHHRLNFNNISEAIVVEGDAGMEWHGVTWLQTPDPDKSIPGNYSRYRMLISQLWPSFVIMPGAKIYYDHTFAITRSETPFSTVAATFAGWGFGDSFYTINSTAYIVRGYHVQQRGVQDLIANTTVGTCTLQLNNVTVVRAADVAALLAGTGTNAAKGHAHFGWRGGILVALVVTIVLTAAFLCWVFFVKPKRSQKESYLTYNETEMGS